jgi:GntR family transcriptional regulator / MocR family aminotransferase
MPSDWSNLGTDRDPAPAGDDGAPATGRDSSPVGDDGAAGAGHDLHIAPDVSGGRQAGLERSLRDAIASGRLPAGTRLPSTRSLATDLGWARGTVAGAYSQLVAEGWLAARAGAGTIVSAAAAAPEAPVRDRQEPRPPRYDLRAGNPDVASFPRADWAAALRRVLREAPDEALRLGDPRGRIELRRALAAYLGRARGVVAEPERIVVCSGFAQALALIAAVLPRRATVAMEDPCLKDHRDVIRAAGHEILPVRVDQGGAKIDDLVGGARRGRDRGARVAGRGADAVVVTPAHQIGLGATLAPERRAALAAWARDDGGLVLEDDYDGEFRYDRQPVGALQALAPAHIAYAGTASKALAPALRLAWLVLPEPLVEPVVEAKRLADSATPAIEQLALANLIESGALDRHLRRARTRYRRRRDALLEALPPTVNALGVAAGLHVTLALPPDGPGEDELVEAARRRSLALSSLRRFWHDPEGRPPHLMVGYATPPDHAFPRAVELLSELLGRPGS